MAIAEGGKTRLKFEASRAFSPSAPIDEQALFAGRTKQIEQVIDAINQRGRHAIIYGERGVGKTSLANILKPWLESFGEKVIAPRVNCDGADTFASAWRKMLSEIRITQQSKAAGFTGDVKTSSTTIADTLKDEATPDTVRQILAPHGGDTIIVMIFDEFDRLHSKEIQSLFADTVKTLSDHSIRVTLVLVGVADTVDQLIAEHLSVERALVQIRMTRMSPIELSEIIQRGVTKVNMTVEELALQKITALSQGLPHYTHLLGLHAAKDAIDDGSKVVMAKHVSSAVTKAVSEAQQTILNTYHKATMSPRKDNLYTEVLLACALAEADELGYFAASDIRDPLNKITTRDYDVPNFSQHLKNFCDHSRGPILQRTGVKHRYRYRFQNPLMQPFVTLKGFADKLIDLETLQAR